MGSYREPPELARGGPVPESRQIADWLRDCIEIGDFAAGVPLPPESWLQESFGVSRKTARRAVGILRAEGLVYTAPQRGTFVTR